MDKELGELVVEEGRLDWNKGRTGPKGEGIDSDAAIGRDCSCRHGGLRCMRLLKARIWPCLVNVLRATAMMTEAREADVIKKMSST